MRFPRANIDVSQYQEQIKALLNNSECAIFIDTNIISQLYRLNDAARQDFYKWIDYCGERFHVPVWVIHEYSNKVYSQKTKDYLLELDKIKVQSKEFDRISDFVKGYVGDSLLQGSIYQGKIEELKKDVDSINSLLSRISNTINSNLEEHQRVVHEEIERVLSKKALNSDIYSIAESLDGPCRQRYENLLPPGYKDSSKEENLMGDLIIWCEILQFCKEQNVRKAILITRDQKLDIVYEPKFQTVDGRKASNTERIKIAQESLVYEFALATKSNDFYVIDFKTFVRLFASDYRELAKSFQLATAEEEKENSEISDLDTITEFSSDSTNQEKSENSIETNVDVSQPYLGTALFDGQYDLELSNGCMDSYIEQLKSYNWYIQNSAIENIMKQSKIGADDTIVNRSSVFVLGRNILQSAEGSSGNAISFLEGLSRFIKDWEPVFKKALIDGILFEMYFNSRGEVRPMRFKATFFEEVMTNINKLGLEEPYKFINEKLSKVRSRFVPMVGSNTIYKFKFTIDNNGNTISLSCNDIDISETFKNDYGSDFSIQEQLKTSLMLYYGIDKNYIQIEGVPSNQNSVKFIVKEDELPF